MSMLQITRDLFLYALSVEVEEPTQTTTAPKARYVEAFGAVVVHCIMRFDLGELWLGVH